jgi:rhamnosyltransferase
MRPRVHCSVVIRAYNEEKHIGRLLEGIRRQTVSEVEVILVDSGSTDSTAAIAEQHGARVVHIPPEEFTFGRSLNMGLAVTNSELVAIASGHVYPVYPDWLERLFEPFIDPEIALTYGKQRGDENTKFAEKQIFARWFPGESVLRQSHPFCNNANAAIRRSLWELHPYDETLTGLEDLDWAKWALAEGHAISYTSSAEVIHIHEESPAAVRGRYQREAMAFKHLYPEAHFSMYDFVHMTLANIASDLWHAGRERLFWMNVVSIFWFRIMQFWGTYQGYHRSLEWNWQLRQAFYYPHAQKLPENPIPRDVDPIRYNNSK